MIAAFARTFNWSDFNNWLYKKYSKTYAYNIYRYSKKYNQMLDGDLRKLELLSPYVKDHAVKALTTLAKYLGIYQQFKKRLNDYGIKTFRPNAFASFLRMMNNNSNGDLLQWYGKTKSVLRPNEQLFLEFVAETGLRKSEAIKSYNLIIRLCETGDLDNYYNEELNALEHFRFEQSFLRRTKNVYISFLPVNVVLKTSKSDSVAYWALLNRLKRRGLKMHAYNNRWIYFEYEHSTLEIVIIPEFPLLIILPLFMIASLLATLAYRRKRAKPDRTS